MQLNKQFKGKAIYNPSGKAGEYSYWACNFYNGCSNGCEYCYCKKGILAKTMGGNIPTLKKCFTYEYDAMCIFDKELKKNKEELQKHGLFFSFSTDPMLPETIWLTFKAVNLCLSEGIPVKILTKVARYNEVICSKMERAFKGYEHRIAIGFTLTGHDELEPGASTNQERIEAMKKLHDLGFKTFASIEPVIDFKSSYEMIKQTMAFCDLYKIGLLSGKKFNRDETVGFIIDVGELLFDNNSKAKIYWKDGLLKTAGVNRDVLGIYSVGRDYNLFKNQT